MKGDIKEIAKKISPETSIEEALSYCDSLEDFDELFKEYMHGQGEECEGSISQIIMEEDRRQREAIEESRKMAEKYRRSEDN